MKAKKILSMILAVVLACSMLATYALAANPTSYNVWVGGTQVTSANMDDVLGDGTVKFTPGTKCEAAKLTLDGAMIDGVSCEKYGAGIYSKIALTIETVSASVVNGADANCLVAAAIAGNCNLTFTGAGKLTVNGPAVKAGSSYGVYSVGGTVRVNGGNVDAKGGQACCNSFAVFAPTVIVNDGKLSALGSSKTVDSVGIKCGTLIINGGEVIAKGGVKGCPIFNASYGVCAASSIIKAGHVIAAGQNRAIFGCINLCKYKSPCIYAGHCYDGSDAKLWKDTLLDCLSCYQYIEITPWEAPVDYTLTFETNGGTPVNPVVVPCGTCLDLSTYTTTKDGFVFDGWYLEPELTTKLDCICLTGNMTVYAKWVPAAKDEFTLTFETNGGTPIEAVKAEDGTTIDLSGYTTTKEGFDFVGWFADPELTIPVATVLMDANKTVYAKWTPTPVDETEVLVKIGFTKSVVIGKNTTPGKASFTFDVKAVEDVKFVVVNSTVETDGKGDFAGEIVLKVKKVDLEKLAKGVVITENANPDTDWACSADSYTVKFTVADGAAKDFTFTKNGEAAAAMAFVNTYNKYTNPTDDTPDTGDETHMMLLAAIATVCLAGAAVLVFGKKFGFNK